MMCQVLENEIQLWINSEPFGLSIRCTSKSFNFFSPWLYQKKLTKLLHALSQHDGHYNQLLSKYRPPIINHGLLVVPYNIHTYTTICTSDHESAAHKINVIHWLKMFGSGIVTFFGIFSQTFHEPNSFSVHSHDAFDPSITFNKTNLNFNNSGLVV